MKHQLTYLLIFILCIGLPVFVRAQDKLPENVQIDSLLTNMHAQEEDTNKIKALLDLSYAYHITSPYDGIKYGRQALAMAEEFKWDLATARANSVLGANYYALSQFSDAYVYWERALRINEKIGNKPGKANHLHNIGNIFFSQGDYVKAKKYYWDALVMNKELGAKKALTNSYTAMGNVYDVMKEYDTALSFHNQALQIDQELNNDNDIAADMMNIGAVYSDYGQCVKALEYLFKALDIKKRTGDKNGLARTYGCIGKTFLNIANDTVIHGPGNDTCSKTNRPLNLQRAVAYLDSAITIDQEIGFLDNLQKTSRYLSEAQEIMGNYKEALAAYKRSSELKDSIYSSANSSKIFDIETNGKIEAKDKELKSKEVQHKYFMISIVAMFVIIGLLAAVVGFVLKSNAKQRKSNEIVKAEKRKSEDLLLNILPAKVANELKATGTSEARLYNDVTVLFTDFVNFTKISETLSPKELVHELNECFCAFDLIMDKHGVEKIKTIGDAYHAVCGLPLPKPDHAECVVNAALEIREFIINRRSKLGDKTFDIRIGIHSGNVIAGIVGVRKFTYDIWGDTVNMAARMEQNSEAGKINISQTTYELVSNKFFCTGRGLIEVKGKGVMSMYFVQGKIN